MANPLTLIMPLQARADLRVLLPLLEQQRAGMDQALTILGTVHFAQFVLLDAAAANFQPAPSWHGPFKLAVIIFYDGMFTTFVRDFVEFVGPEFDKILAFTENGAAFVPVKQHVAGFTAFVAANDASQHRPNSQVSMYGAYTYPAQEIVAYMPR